jgi:hypothetical protein
MSYKIDEKLIHDDDAMWSLALTFKTNYNFIKEQVERIEVEKKNSILVNGKIVMAWDTEFKPALHNYKEKLKYMNELLEFELKVENNRLQKYVIKV